MIYNCVLITDGQTSGHPVSCYNLCHCESKSLELCSDRLTRNTTQSLVCELEAPAVNC